MQKKGKERGRSWWSSGSLLLLVLLAGSGVTYYMLVRDTSSISLKYGELIKILGSARSPQLAFRDVRLTDSDITGKIVSIDRVSDGDQNGNRQDEVRFRTQRTGLKNDRDLLNQLQKAGADFEFTQDESALGKFFSLAIWFVLLAGMAVATFMVISWLMGNGSPLTFGRSRHKLHAQQDTEVTFQDVAGIDEAVAELREVVDFLKRPQKYQALGGRIPKGVLLVGPPGTGKTLLAKAVAGEAEVPFFSMSGSDFVEMFVGVGAARVRDLFDQAEGRAPCIIFIDELDALGKTRGGGLVGSHDEREQTLNQLLVEMDGFDSNRGVIIMAATNRPETLDIALLRPGRFDRTVVVDRPDINGREAILKVHIRHVRLGEDVDLRRVAGLTPGTVGADLANLVNEAALMAARAGKEAVMMAEFDEAIERGAVGLERKSRIMHADEKQRVAYHEAGHALVTCVLPNTHPVHKVSIIPRGIGALGYVLSRPEQDRYLVTQSELLSQIKVALGGTIAEELTFREVSSGATSDLEQASRIARSMVKEFGMSPMGRVNFAEQSGPAFLSNSPWREGESPYSEQTAREIDVEVRKIIDDATNEVRAILQSHRSALEAVAQRLIDKEVMDGSELRQFLEQHHPGPKLVPGSLPLEGRAASPGVPGQPPESLSTEERSAAPAEGRGGN